MTAVQSQTMKVSLAFIISVLLLSSAKRGTTHVNAFSRVLSRVSSNEHVVSYGISTSSILTSLNSLNHDANENENINEDMEEIRKARLGKESSGSNRFASGEELAMLREDISSLEKNLEWARALKDDDRIESLEEAIGKGQKRDPFFMHDKAKKIIAEAKKMEDVSDEEKEILIEKWSSVESDARECLPHLNMEGLWVGNYGESKGLQLINITYTGDEMIATKVTGDINVPRGERSFTVNVKPSNSSALPPVKLVSEQQSGEFDRFPGRGQVSRKGFKDNRYVEAQMILFEDRFSFVWIPTKHHVSFHRPSPETTLKLLRNTISKEDEIENMREHVSRCFDMDLSTAIARQQDPYIVHEPLRRILTQEELEKVDAQFKQGGRKNLFLQIGKWRSYIDQVLDKNSS